MAKLSYLEAIREAQDLALQQNKDVFILGEDVGKGWQSRYKDNNTKLSIRSS